jgi:glutaminyl-peptide cyclotransferase
MTPAPPETVHQKRAARLRVEVLAEHPHDPSAFTQGLVLDGDTLYESVGNYGKSALRQVDLLTGLERRRVKLPPGLFGEGLARVGERLIQLTWKERRALVWDVQTFERLGEHRYTGEGWGLCYTGEHLLMSDGSERLTAREPSTFKALGGVSVTLDGKPVIGINELEYAQGFVYANVWQNDKLLRIDPATGCVLALIDATELRRRLGVHPWSVDVLNGICFSPARKSFFLTGKFWPKLFEVAVVP